MRKIAKKIILLVVLPSCIILVFYLLFRAVAVEKQNYSWSEMDWDQDGQTTLSEYFMSSDIGKRSVSHGGKECLEYFSYKDGLTVILAC